MRENTSKPGIIDVEASGFGQQSYPIEVGVVLDDGKRYSRLIRPFPDWTHWCEQAQSTHKISREMLQRYGVDPHEVAIELNDLLAGQTLYSDCWGVDKPWIDALYYRCAMPLNFSVSPLEAILSEAQMTCWEETKQVTINTLDLERHRASTDALIIQETFVRTRATGSVLTKPDS